MFNSSDTRFFSMITLGAAIVLCLTGCGVFHSGQSPFGSAVVEGGEGGGSIFGGDTVDVSSGNHVASDRERLNVFVADPVIATKTLRQIKNFDTASFSELVRRSTEESLSAFGRFAVVIDENDAILTIEPRVISAIPWSDTVTKEDGFNVSDITGSGASGNEVIHINREGIDVSISLSFRRTSDLAFIANERATGRLSMSKGDIFRGFTASSDKGSGGATQFQKLDQAAIDEARLAEIINDTVRGVIILMLDQFDGSWWHPISNESNYRLVNVDVFDG